MTTATAVATTTVRVTMVTTESRHIFNSGFDSGALTADVFEGHKARSTTPQPKAQNAITTTPQRANLFRAQGRERILRALETPPDPIAEAKEKIKKMGRTPEDFVPLLLLPPGQAHRTAAITYQQRNIEEGKRCVCPMPLAPNSVRYCEKQLAACRG